jgi:branched-chain amino acid transport system ATP-binding protein
MYLLQVRNLKKHFGGVKALNGVGFDIRSGECVALIGPNGAGKSTCFAALAGQQTPDAGSVHWGDETGQEAGHRNQGASDRGAHGLRNVTGLSAARLSPLGIGRTFQVAQVFEALTVLQNLQLATHVSSGLVSFLPLKNQSVQACEALLSQIGLDAVAHSQALLLPYGLKKRLELGIALAASPKLLLLDEPAAGLAESERHDLMTLVKGLTRRATDSLAVLYTEHNMDAVFGVADRVLVLIDGQLAAQGTAEQIAQDPTVRQRYLGTGVHGAAQAQAQGVVHG